MFMGREKDLDVASKQYAWANDILRLDKGSCCRAVPGETKIEDIAIISIGDIVSQAFIAGAVWADFHPYVDRPKLYCDHRGGLLESLHTTFECPNGVDDIMRHAKGRYIRDIRIDKDWVMDDRLPSYWGGGLYRVFGTYVDGSNGIVGWCNFTE